MFRDKRSIIGAVAALAALTLSACGGPNPGAPTQAQNKPAESGASEDSTQGAGKVVTKIVGKKMPKIGNVVMDSKGWIFYRFDEDSAKPTESNCTGECAELWPPVLTKNGKDLPVIKGIDPEKVGTVKREDGAWQLTIGNWPVYRYIGDKKPGTWKGQGVSGNWFVVTKDGKKNLSVLPKGTPKPVSLPKDADESSSGSDDADTYGDGGGYGGY